jgi:hypothetical protein
LISINWIKKEKKIWFERERTSRREERRKEEEDKRGKDKGRRRELDKISLKCKIYFFICIIVLFSFDFWFC